MKYMTYAIVPLYSHTPGNAYKHDYVLSYTCKNICVNKGTAIRSEGYIHKYIWKGLQTSMKV